MEKIRSKTLQNKWHKKIYQANNFGRSDLRKC